MFQKQACWGEVWTVLFRTSTVWYKTKVGRQNFVHQQWWWLVYGLPKLVTNISYKFHHLVNTVLAACSLVKWIPIKVTHTPKIDEIWMVYCSPIGIGSIRLLSPWTQCTQWNLTSNNVGHFCKLVDAHNLEKNICPCLLLWELIFSKSYHYW